MDTDNRSPAEILADLPEEDRQAFLSEYGTDTVAALINDWSFWARPNQLAPTEEWRTWLILAGRGFGKTRTGAEWVREMALQNPGCRIAMVAETSKDVRHVMVGGESGLMGIHSKDEMPEFQPTNSRVTWPNGSVAYLYNATEPDQLRGPQHHFAWCDELAKWQYCQETWDQLQFGLRLGTTPKTVITTTPRPLPILKKLMVDKRVFVTRGSTRENAANMPSSFIDEIMDKYAGTRLGRQEIDGEILDDIPGALWNRETLDQCRLLETPTDLERVFVAVDPAVTSGEDADEHGIVVVGLARDTEGYARGYVLEDASRKGQPEDWARTAVRMYRKWQADKIIAEKNQGGEMVLSVIRAEDRTIPVELVHATRGKIVRAEPISTLYEQGRIHHVGRFDLLEDQMCLFAPDLLRGGSRGSPDRVDALVWGMTKLFDKITGRARKTEGRGVIEKKNEFNIKDYVRDSETGWMI